MINIVIGQNYLMNARFYFVYYFILCGFSFRCHCINILIFLFSVMYHSLFVAMVGRTDGWICGFECMHPCPVSHRAKLRIKLPTLAVIIKAITKKVLKSLHTITFSVFRRAYGRTIAGQQTNRPTRPTD